jgi:FlaG/FlaF family flagellin (archaellin)
MIVTIILVIVILVIVIPIILAAALYFMATGMIESSPETAPNGALNLMQSSDVEGKYTGGFISLSRHVDITDVSVTITDASTDSSASITLTASGGYVAVGSGLNLNFVDSYDNDLLDEGDVITINNGESGDSIKFTYEPTGETISMYTLF